MDTPYLKTLQEKIAPGNAALIVVDVQKDFCSKDGAFGTTVRDFSMVEAMLPNLQRLVDGARKVGVPVIFIQAIYDPVYLPPAWHERNARRNVVFPRCITGTPGADFYKVKPLPGETIVQKHRYSAFVETELDMLLRSRQISTVIMTGVATNVCVEFTARDAFMRNYYVAFVDDASATYSAEQHKATLVNIAQNFGEVNTVQEILDAWRVIVPS